MLEEKGKRRNRVILLLVLLTCIAVGTLYGVWCYSSAEVNSDAELSVVPSEEALIAVDIVDAISITQGETGLLGTITNNTAESVDLTIISTFAGNFIYDVLLAPGVSTDLELEIPADVLPGEYPVEGIVQARWDEGSAEIGFELMVTVLPGLDLTGEGLAPAGAMLFDSFNTTGGDVPGTAGEGSRDGDGSEGAAGTGSGSGEPGGDEPGTAGAAGSVDGDGSEGAAGTGSGSGESGGDEPGTGSGDGSSANGDSDGTAASGGDTGEAGSGDATGTGSSTDSGGGDAGSGDSGSGSDGDSSGDSSSGSEGDSSGDSSSGSDSSSSSSDSSGDAGDSSGSEAGE